MRGIRAGAPTTANRRPPVRWRGLARRLSPAAAVALTLAGTASTAAAVDVPGPPGDVDGRKYEQVSPAQKLGYNVGSNIDGALHAQVAPDGTRIAYDSAYPYPPAEVGSTGGYVSERAATGWGTAAVLKTHGPNSFGGGPINTGEVSLRGSTPDGRASVYWDSTTAPFGALWLRRSDGSRALVAAGTALGIAMTGTGAQQPWFLGMSADGRHVVFNTASRLGPAASLPPGSNRILYEWVDDGSDGGAGSLRVVNRTDDPDLALVDGATASLGGGVALAGWRLTPPQGTSNSALRNAVSADGDRIFFQAPAPSGPADGGGPLYLREGGLTTTEVSAPEAGHTPVSPPSATGIAYVDAARDGSRVFFYADGDLTGEAPPTGGLYRYDVASGALRWLDDAPSGVLTTGLADAAGQRLYYQRGPDVYTHDGDQPRVVRANAPVVSEDLPAGGGIDAASELGIRTNLCPSAGVTPDGRYFVFTANPDGVDQAGYPLAVFRFDAESGDPAELISTGPNAPAVSRGAGFSALCRGGVGRTVEKRVISDDGRYVFFDTADPLVETDANGQIDAYRWRADGEVTLISTGRSTRAASFQGSDASGATAFFVSEERLVPQDGDGVYDLYAARIGGGFPYAAPPPPCAGDSCQGARGAPPARVRPGSDRLAGSGDVAPAARVARVRAPRRKVGRGARLLLRVQAPARGRLVVSGRAVRRSGRRVARAGTYRVPVVLRVGARRALRDRGSVATRVKVRFKPSSGRSSSTVRVSLRFKARSARKGR